MLNDVTMGDKTFVGSPVGIRHLRFTGAKNFRDLGGYQTADGRTVRWGLLYRSDALHALTDFDLERLSALSLSRVIDFRSDYERQQAPDRLPAGGNIPCAQIPILDASTALVQVPRDELAKKLRNVDPHEYLHETYVGFVTRFTPDFRLFFRELVSAGGQPVLVHCTAGKDRTGFAAAILLRLLGVPHETVIQDYLLTNEYFFAHYKWNLVLARLMKGGRFADAIRGFMRAEPQYLSTAFDTMDREFGSFERYIRDGIGLSPTEVEHLRTTYLE